MIKANGINKKYGDFVALKDISFEFKKGEVIGLLGPNGAGKTTLLRILVGFLKPTSGKIEVDSLDLNKPINVQKIKSKIGYLPEQAPLYEEMLVIEYLDFIGRMQGISKDEIDSKIEKVVKTCGLLEKKNAEISSLSKGYRQRVGIAQALIHDPEIVILDEPTTGLDPKQRIEIRDLILKIGKERTVILSSHILSEVQSTCSRVLIINQGKIVADGDPKELEKNGQKKSIVSLQIKESAEKVLDLINNITGVIDSKLSEGCILISMEKDVDVRAEISSVVVKGGFSLIGLRKEKLNLEDIFINITSERNEK